MTGALVRVIGGVGLLSLLVTASAFQDARPSRGAETVGQSQPILVRHTMPTYTIRAFEAGIEGVVELEAVVLPDGSVGRLRVTRSLDLVHGLDARAMAAARQWRFRPAELLGEPFPVVVPLAVPFRLDDPDQRPERPRDDPEFARGAWVDGAPGLVSPVPTDQVAPRYTPEASRAKIQGAVVIEAVVGVDGRVTRARVSRSLDTFFGLDQAALAAAKAWRFEPGTVDGKPVPALVTIRLEFRHYD